MHQDNASAAKIKKRRDPPRITEKYLANAGAAYLQRFAASKSRFRQVMMRKIDRSWRFYKDFDKADSARLLDALIEKFEGLGYLNDQAYSEAYVRSARARGLSSRSIAVKLKTRGLGDNNIDRGEDERAAAIFMRKRRLGPYARTEREKESTRYFATMARAGFAYDLARRLQPKTIEELEDLARD